MLALLALVIFGDHGVQAIQTHTLRTLNASPSYNIEGIEPQQALEPGQDLRFEESQAADALVAATDAQVGIEPITTVAAGIAVIVWYMSYRRTMRATRMAARRNAAQAKLREVAEQSAELASKLSSVMEGVVGEADSRFRDVITSVASTLLSDANAPLKPAQVGDLACQVLQKQAEANKDENDPTKPPELPKELQPLAGLMLTQNLCKEGKFIATSIDEKFASQVRAELRNLLQHDLDNEIGLDVKLRGISSGDKDKESNKEVGTSNLEMFRTHTSNIILGQLSPTLGAFGKALMSSAETEEFALENSALNPGEASEKKAKATQLPGSTTEEKSDGDIKKAVDEILGTSTQLDDIDVSTNLVAWTVNTNDLISKLAKTVSSGAQGVNSMIKDALNTATTAATMTAQQGDAVAAQRAATISTIKSAFTSNSPATVGPPPAFLRLNALELKVYNDIVAAGPILTQLVSLGLQIHQVSKDAKAKQEDLFRAARQVGIAYERLENDREMGIFNLCRITQILRSQLRSILSYKPTDPMVQNMDIASILGLSSLSLDAETKKKLSMTFFARLCIALEPMYERAGSLFRSGGVCAATDAAAVDVLNTRRTSSYITPAAQLKAEQGGSQNGKLELEGAMPSREHCSSGDIYDVQLVRQGDVTDWTQMGYEVVAMPEDDKRQDVVTPLQLFKDVKDHVAASGKDAFRGELNAAIKGEGDYYVTSLQPASADSRVLMTLNCLRMPAFDDPNYERSEWLKVKEQDKEKDYRTAPKSSPFIMAHVATLQQPISDIVLVKRDRQLRKAVSVIASAKGKYKDITARNGYWKEWKRALKVGNSYRAPVPIDASDEEKRLTALGYEPVLMLKDWKESRAALHYNSVKDYMPEAAKYSTEALKKAKEALGDSLTPSSFLQQLGAVQEPLNRNRQKDSQSAEFAIYVYVLRGGASAINKVILLPFLTPFVFGKEKKGQEQHKIKDLKHTELLQFEEEVRAKFVKATSDEAAMGVLKTSGSKTLATMVVPRQCEATDTLEAADRVPKPRDYPEVDSDKWVREVGQKALYHRFSVTCQGTGEFQKWSRVGMISPFEDLLNSESVSTKAMLPYLWVRRRLHYPDDAREEGSKKAPGCGNECDLIAQGQIYPRFAGKQESESAFSTMANNYILSPQTNLRGGIGA